MAQYIDKDALVKEIDKRLSYYKDLKDRGILSKEGEAAYRVVRILKSDINSLDTFDVKEVKEVPVSEELEEATIEYCGGNKGSDARVRTGFIMGAKWQKEQDKETIELAEDHAMLAGMEKMKEQMMKDAVDGIVGYYNQRGLSISMNLPKDLEENDKVKLIIIKQHKLS